MSLFGAMNTAISGLNAQSAAFSNIGDNIANSQTIGFKGVDTSFDDYLTDSSAEINESGSVVTRPDYQNEVQGAISQTSTATNLAIAGQGFFTVAKQDGTTGTDQPTFDGTPEYTRAGDFSQDKNGYLVNSSGLYLEGWLTDASGNLNQSTVAPIQVGQSTYAPVPTANVTLSANLPATPSTSTVSTTVPVYDSLGASHNLNLTWTPVNGTSDTWTVSVTQDSSTTPIGTATVAFGAAGNAAAPQGTIGAISNATGALTGSTFAAGGTATLGVAANFGSGNQNISLNLGTFGQSNGLTQYAGTNYSLRSMNQDGVPAGSFSSVTIATNGNVVVNYDNGQSRTVAQVPITTFANADALQRQDGQAFTVTTDSGVAQTDQIGQNGAGNLVISSTEASNVDIGTQFTKLIVAQQAYTASTKLITTADDMLQATIDMKR